MEIAMDQDNLVTVIESAYRQIYFTLNPIGT